MYRIAAAGGGFHMSAKSFTVDQLYRIAAAASRHGARITITEANHLTTDQLYQVAAAGKMRSGVRIEESLRTWERPEGARRG